MVIERVVDYRTVVKRKGHVNMICKHVLRKCRDFGRQRYSARLYSNPARLPVRIMISRG